MKKTVIIILALLPIVLLVMISIATHVFETYSHVEVESVAFSDSAGNILDDSAVFTVSVGETKATSIIISPTDATDKRVSYTSTDETICTVDPASGAVTGVRAGYVTIVVKTADGEKIDMLSVVVRASSVTSVTLTPDSLDMMIGESKDLTVNVEPYSATNKNVTYTSSNPSVVTVSNVGKLRAVGAGTATITVRTVDGGLTDTCTVTVTDNTPPISFDFTSVSGIQSSGKGYKITDPTIDLKSGLKFDGDQFELSDIKFLIENTGDASVDENGILSFAAPGITKVKVYVGDVSAPEYYIEVIFAWLG